MRRVPSTTTRTREECLRRAQDCDWHAQNSPSSDRAAEAFDEARYWRSLALVAQPAASPEPATSPDLAAPDADPYDLKRFVQAQAPVFETALKELRDGRKRSHWMWFVFPQLRGLGSSWKAQLYGISGEDEARAYLAHPLLGPRLHAAVDAVDASGAPWLRFLFGSPDDLKFRSSMTLFALASDDPFWQGALDRWCAGKCDAKTLEGLGPASLARPTSR